METHVKNDRKKKKRQRLEIVLTFFPHILTCMIPCLHDSNICQTRDSKIGLNITVWIEYGIRVEQMNLSLG